MLSEAEKKMVDEFAQKIDVTDSNLVLQYGAAAQKNIAAFSENALNSVKTKDLGEVGQALSDLVVELKGFGEEEEEKKPAKAKKKAAAVKGPKGGPAVRRPAQTAQIDLDEEDDFDDFEDYEEEDFDDYGTMEMEDLDADEYDDYEEEDDEIIDDLDELLSSQPKKKRSHMEPDDTFKVDFIDLD